MSGRPVWYGGIADTDGLESCMFLHDREEMVAQELMGTKPEGDHGSELLNMLELRARYNSQRHAIVYTAFISKADAARVCELVGTEGPRAYFLLQELADQIRIHSGSPEEFMRLPQIARAMGRRWNVK